MAMQTLGNIITKVRRLTRSPSSSQITATEIREYIDTFLLYDLPSQLRLFNLRTNLTFYTQPGQDTYATELYGLPRVPTDPLFNFKNVYIAVHPPIYLAGVLGSYTQDQASYFVAWPRTNFISDTVLRGTGGTGPFAGNLSSFPVLQNNVAFTCLSTTGTALTVTDTPISNSFGNLKSVGSTAVLGLINYLTGAFSFSFLQPTKVGAPIYSETVPYLPGQPLAVLFYDNTFTLRPVPDKAYQVRIEVDIRPTELVNIADVPQLEQWCQYIAYGAAKKIFEDRMDLDSVALIMDEFKNQEAMALRTTLETQCNERTKTIYNQGRQYTYSPFDISSWPY